MREIFEWLGAPATARAEAMASSKAGPMRGMMEAAEGNMKDTRVPGLTHELRRILLRELATLAREVDLYPDDGSLWKGVPGLTNPGGNLALHLCGNLRHFIGATLGGTGFVRNRDAEFAAKDLPKAVVLEEIQATALDVGTALDGLAPARLLDAFPIAFGGQHLGTDAFLLHLASHLAFHLGQVDYHRRAATCDARGAGAVAISELMPPVSGN